MRIDIITVLPEMIEGFFNCSIMKRAQDKGLAEIHIHNLRDYTEDKYRRVDDYPFGGFAGMVMKIEPIERCINTLKAERDYDEVIFTTPDGEQFDQKMANSLSLSGNLIILCGHFKGIDYRIREHLITKEISIGDYHMTVFRTALSRHKIVFALYFVEVRAFKETSACTCPYGLAWRELFACFDIYFTLCNTMVALIVLTIGHKVGFAVLKIQ